MNCSHYRSLASSTRNGRYLAHKCIWKRDCGQCNVESRLHWFMLHIRGITIMAICTKFNLLAWGRITINSMKDNKCKASWNLISIYKMHNNLWKSKRNRK